MFFQPLALMTLVTASAWVGGAADTITLHLYCGPLMSAMVAGPGEHGRYLRLLGKRPGLRELCERPDGRAHLVLLYHLGHVRLRLGHVGLVVDLDQFDRAAVDPAIGVDVLHLQIGTLADRHAGSRARPCEAVGEADLDRLSGGRPVAAVVSVLGAAVSVLGPPSSRARCSRRLRRRCRRGGLFSRRRRPPSWRRPAAGQGDLSTRYRFFIPFLLSLLEPEPFAPASRYLKACVSPGLRPDSWPARDHPILRASAGPETDDGAGLENDRPVSERERHLRALLDHQAWSDPLC